MILWRSFFDVGLVIESYLMGFSNFSEEMLAVLIGCEHFNGDKVCQFQATVKLQFRVESTLQNITCPMKMTVMGGYDNNNRLQQR